MSEKITVVEAGLSYQPWYLRRHVVTLLVNDRVGVRRFWTRRRAEAWIEALRAKAEGAMREKEEA